MGTCQIWPWPEPLQLVDLICYSRLLKMRWEPTSREFFNLPGVDIDVFDFGGFDGLTFGDMAIGTFAQYGYRQGVNLWGAPFDWRLPSQGHQRLYTDLKALVEKAYNVSQKKVAILAPSYGPQVILGFLQQMPQDWKDRYISWFVAASPVWSGSSTALYGLISGLSLVPNSTDLITRIFRDLELQIPSMMWLSPVPGEDEFTYGENLSLMLTPNQTYSAYDLAKMLNIVGYSELVPVAQYLQTSGSLYKFEPPMVNTWVSYGYNVVTPETFTFATPLSAQSMPHMKNFTLMSGDDIVTLRSSLRGTLWTEAHQKANKQLIHSGFDAMLHAACLLPGVDLNHSTCFREMMDLLLNGTLPRPTPPPPHF